MFGDVNVLYAHLVKHILRKGVAPHGVGQVETRPRGL